MMKTSFHKVAIYLSMFVLVAVAPSMMHGTDDVESIPIAAIVNVPSRGYRDNGSGARNRSGK